MITHVAADTHQLFEASRGLPTESRVDRKARTIFGAKAMQFGPLNKGDGRPWKVDQTTLEQLRDLVNAKPGGVKMRFAHPNMSRDGMGRHLGRATNARIVDSPDGAYVAVDAKIADPPANSKAADMAEHVLSLAETAPEDFGLSIAPLMNFDAMRKIEPDAESLTPIRLEALRAIDFVDEPAATRGGLFSLDSGELADLPAVATHVFDTYFSDAPADVIRARFGEFLDRYLVNRGDEPMSNEPAKTEHGAGKLGVETAPKTGVEVKADGTPAVATLGVVAAVATPFKIEADLAREQLQRRAEIGALCKLAKVDDATKELMIQAGFSRAEAQQYLATSGHLSAVNPPVVEGVEPPSKTPDPDAKFAAEYDEHADVFSRQGLTKEQYIASRKKG